MSWVIKPIVFLALISIPILVFLVGGILATPLYVLMLLGTTTIPLIFSLGIAAMLSVAEVTGEQLNQWRKKIADKWEKWWHPKKITPHFTYNKFTSSNNLMPFNINQENNIRNNYPSESEIATFNEPNQNKIYDERNQFNYYMPDNSQVNYNNYVPVNSHTVYNNFNQ